MRRLNIIGFLKRKYWSWRVRGGIRVLEDLDEMMKRAYWPRHRRRGFWRDFVKRQGNRELAYEELKRKGEMK